MSDFGKVIISIIAAILVLVLLLIGANEHWMQAISTLVDNVPLIGPALSTVSAFTQEQMQVALSEKIALGINMLFKVLTINLWDSVFLGAFYAIVDYGVRITGRFSGRNGGASLPLTFLITFISVILLVMFSFLESELVHVLLMSVGSIGIILLGIGIMLRRQTRRGNIMLFAFRIILGAFQTCSGICCMGSILLFGHFCSEYSFGAAIISFGITVLLFLVVWLVVAAGGIMEDTNYT